MRWNVTTVVAPNAKDIVQGLAASFAEQNAGPSQAAVAQAEAVAGAVEAILATGTFGGGPYHVSVVGNVGDGKKAERGQDDENSLSITIREGDHYVNPVIEEPVEEEGV